MQKSLLLFLVTIMLFPFLSSAEIVEKIVATVNSEVVLLSDFSILQTKIKKRALLDENLIPEPPSDFFKGDRTSLLNYLINERLLDSEVKRLNLSVTDAKVDQEIKDIAKRNRITADDVLQAVKSEGVTVDEYKSSLKTRLERQSLIESEVISKLRISDEDALSEYMRKNPHQKLSINEFSLAHIFFNPRKDGAQAAIKRAELVLSKLRSGENFEVLADQHSEDPNYSKGGFLGSFKSGEFLPEVEDVVSLLSPGQTSEIVKSKMGFHIVKLISKNLSTDPKFEREKEKIKSQIFEETFRRQLRLWLQMKRDDAFLKINEK